MLVAESNAVNLTDGLDGLAISVFAIAAAAYTALAYVTGHRVLADYLLLVRFPQAAELTVFCGSLVGASLGFLWYNSYPAEIFMGDVGSLALGAALGTVAILIKQELLLVIVGGVFVLEALSVVIQVGSSRRPGQRVFRMAPLHHHFELSGWSEPKVITRFVIVAIIFALFSLATLKLQMTFSTSNGKRVTVAGAARSGLAAAELLARRGARVTLSDSRAEAAGSRAAASAGRRAGARRPHAPRRSRRADLVVLSPGVPPEQDGRAGGAGDGRAGHRRDRAGVALAAGPRDRHHRHERQVDDDRADGTDARGGGLQGDGRRQHRRAAERAGRRSRRPTRSTSSRRAAFSSSRSTRFIRGSP